MRDVIEDRTEQAVLRAVVTMHENLGEQLTVDDLAHAAIFSKFHFSRVFQRVTGLSPGRFLSALRMQEAKRLLRSTSLSVTEISIQVGYSSVGTFSSRFKTNVGLSPTKYRELGRVTLPVDGGQDAAPSATVHGSIASSMGDLPVFAGLFPDRIMKGLPVSCTVLRRPGPYVLRNVPFGSWHLLAFAGERDLDEHPYLGTYGPIVIRTGTRASLADVRLEPVCPLDPPVLLALGHLRPAPA
jgi:AraC family transcriptional regulator